ncbi:MAG: hypothetical protein ABIF77_18055 [bacterium]
MPSLYWSRFLVTITLLACSSLAAAQCGPGCPACSGGASETILDPYMVKGSVLVLPDGEEETAVFNLAGTVLPRLELGVGYARESEQTIWIAKLEAVAERKDSWRPAVILGTGSVETGGSDQSGFLLLFKEVPLDNDFTLGLSGGYAADVPDFAESFGLASLSVIFREKVAPFYNYDGRSSHAGLTWYAAEWLQLTGFALEMETLALSVGIKKTILNTP